jgi:glycerol kinase
MLQQWGLDKESVHLEKHGNKVMKKDCLLAIDQGTTSSRAIVFDTDMHIVSVAQEEFPQIYPSDGWVEHDPEAIWETTLRTARQAFDEAEGNGGRVVAVGITNQRETTVVWDRKSGTPIHNAIVWMDRRTADRCGELKRDGVGEEIQQKTGLLLDPYFSATKIAWLLDHVGGARERRKTEVWPLAPLTVF